VKRESGIQAKNECSKFCFRLVVIKENHLNANNSVPIVVIVKQSNRKLRLFRYRWWVENHIKEWSRRQITRPLRRKEFNFSLEHELCTWFYNNFVVNINMCFFILFNWNLYCFSLTHSKPLFTVNFYVHGEIDCK